MSGSEQKSYRVGVIGFAHMHVNELVDRFASTGRSPIVACADTTPSKPSRTTVEGSRKANLKRTLALPNGPRLYEDYRELLKGEELDIAILCPENARHAEIAAAAAEHGVHALTEKPMAASLEGAQAMAKAAKTAGVKLAVNWPIAWSPAFRALKKLVDDKAIGDLWEVRWRNPASLGPLAHGSLHPGDTVVSGSVSDAEKSAEWWHQAKAGGGALLDYSCYGACLSAWLMLGRATSVLGLTENLRSRYGDAEDNAAMIVRFPAGLSILEASWTTVHNGGAPVLALYGTEGTIAVEGGDILIYREKGSKTPSRVEKGEALPQGRATIAEEFLRHLDTSEPLHPLLDLPLNLATMAILDAGIRSARSGKSEPVERT
ncbi:MAG TPA: Gfo/Idh/MocA family oxidoreductase [Roseiarcus sp.]|nr:Gfo/Idh/MocA family oxidoreductase [Roseiarcus sp.]